MGRKDVGPQIAALFFRLATKEVYWRGETMAAYFSTLKEAMETRGVRAYQLADLIRVSAGTFSMKMHGRIPFAPIERKRISEYFGLSEEVLFEAAFFRHAAWIGGLGPRPAEQASKVENAMAKTPGPETR
jgi:hypothetical protein